VNKTVDVDRWNR